jgi:low affinity Fe/Cu permease
MSRGLGKFDRFATWVAEFTARAWFFAACLALVLIWAPSFFLIGDVDTWQLIINTATTIVTFLLVALLQNTQHRSDRASQHKLNAIAEALADVMDSMERDDPSIRGDVAKLRRAVGLEERQGSSD